MLNKQQADALLDQFHETASYRRWVLLAVGVMRNHCHLVVGVLGDPDPDVLLRDFKSYASRRLNRQAPRPASGTWWTESGSRRKLAKEESILAAIEYVRNQQFPLVIWIDEQWLKTGMPSVWQSK